MAREGDVTIQMSMYGGFEQAGSLGQNLPRDDKQTTTTSGDIVLYSGKWVFIAAPLLGSALAAFCYLGLAGKEKDKMADPKGRKRTKWQIRMRLPFDKNVQVAILKRYKRALPIDG